MAVALGHRSAKWTPRGWSCCRRAKCPSPSGVWTSASAAMPRPTGCSPRWMSSMASIAARSSSSPSARLPARTARPPSSMPLGTVPGWRSGRRWRARRNLHASIPNGRDVTRQFGERALPRDRCALAACDRSCLDGRPRVDALHASASSVHLHGTILSPVGALPAVRGKPSRRRRRSAGRLWRPGGCDSVASDLQPPRAHALHAIGITDRREGLLSEREYLQFLLAIAGHRQHLR